MDTNNEDHDVDYNSAHNPFPEPQTIPSGWDISAILSAPQPVPAITEKDSAEN